MKSAEPIGLYIHFPWCIRKCPYCDFNSHEPKQAIPEQAYIDALLEDLQTDLVFFGRLRRVDTIFFGGGTPSLCSPSGLEKLLAGIKELLFLNELCEVTLEANPGTFDSARFLEFRSLGINRLSIGIQTFSDVHLQKLGRVHSSAEAMKAVEIAHTAGFENLNLDLMFGLPEQSEFDATSDVFQAISLQPTHISHYQLTLEPNTYFYKFPPKLPEHEAVFSTQLSCQDLLAEHGYRQYEISAYALKGQQCRHNRNYWQFGDYLGIGAGAHGKISRSLPEGIVRTVKPKNPDQYIRSPCAITRNAIALEQLPLEFVMNRLRLSGGFTVDEFQSGTGLSRSRLEPGLSECISRNLLVENNERIFCTDLGWNFLDEVLEKFIQ